MSNLRGRLEPHAADVLESSPAMTCATRSLVRLAGADGVLMSGGLGSSSCSPSTPSVTQGAFLNAALSGVVSRQLSITRELQASFDLLLAATEPEEEGAEDQLLDEVGVPWVTCVCVCGHAGCRACACR